MTEPLSVRLREALADRKSIADEGSYQYAWEGLHLDVCDLIPEVEDLEQRLRDYESRDVAMRRDADALRASMGLTKGEQADAQM